ncbi:hypothetical protein LB505_009860 [Fusarium chuoi]|nr:hypothetical protein LB505_009860 [Fusarium chuoi]
MDVNLKGVMWCMRAQIPHLPRPGGAIVNISSTSGLRGFPHNAAYSSSKFGVIGLTSSVAGEFGAEAARSELKCLRRVKRRGCLIRKRSAS